MSLSLICWVFNDKLDQFFTVDVPTTNIVIQLKDRIKQKRSVRLANVDATDLALWNVPSPIEDLTKFDFSQPKLAPLQSISDVFLEQPCMDHVHVIVMAPTRKCKRIPLCPHPGLTSPPVSPSNSDSSLGLDKTWARRPTTVETIYRILNSERLVQVRGTPGSGKTVLLKLLRNHISKVDREAVVHVISSWLNETPFTTLASRLSARLPGVATEVQGVDERMEKTYILFDNGQDTYWDTELWEFFFKDHQQRRNGYRIILFCSYGSASKRIIDYGHGTSCVVRPRAHVSLRRTIVATDCEPVGLLLKREEFDDVVDRSAVVLLGPDLQDFIFDSTDGHVGAVMSMLEALSWLCREKQRNNIALTMADFKAMDKSAFWLDIEYHSAFGRGLATRKQLCRIGVADVFRNLLVNESIDLDSKYGEALEWCHRNGFIQSDAIEEQVYYTLPSPLHEAYLSWRLMPSDVVIRHDTILDFAIAVILQFSPARLLNPPRRMNGKPKDKPPGAQYQKEFYRGLFTLFGGAFRSPEYGTESSARPGRIDFFIEAKKWGIELVRDGKELYEHGSRFDVTGAYGTWFPTNDMLDYLLLDFRGNRPIVTHEIPNLYHVVFEEDYTGFQILDNNLHVVHESGLIEH